MLTGKQRRHLRGLGHALTPVAHLGKAGITDSFVDALDRALADSSWPTRNVRSTFWGRILRNSQ